jgi:methionyl-tRNA formyltransferase
MHHLGGFCTSARLFYRREMAQLAYLGTPDMAVVALRALAAAGHELTLCVTPPDRRRGRGGGVSPSPVKAAAISMGIPVTHSLNDLATSGAELAVVVAYGRIIPSDVLERLPMVNLHFSLLPRWRGAAPVERAILAGDAETGVCVMKVEAGLDTGPVYARRVVPLDDQVDVGTLRSELAEIGSGLLVETVAGGVAGLPPPKAQEGTPTVAAKVTSEDLHLQWEEPATQLHRVVRLGRAWTTFRGKRLGILKAQPGGDDDRSAPPGSLRGTTVVTGQGTLSLLEVQPESRSPMKAADWLRGFRPAESERLGSD